MQLWRRMYGSNVCGEGGEYESLTLDCPLFSRAHIQLQAFDTRLHSPGNIASVGVLRPTAFRLVPKDGIASATDLDANIVEVPAGGRDLVCKSQETFVETQSKIGGDIASVFVLRPMAFALVPQ